MMTKKKIQQQQQQEKPNRRGEGSPDRISELPKEILHHILGFLEMDEFLIGTSLVSTKWRNVWKSVSTLNFNHCPPVGSDGDSVEKYQNFVDHVLRLRDSQASKIHIFSYYCNDIFSYYCNDFSSRGGGAYEYLERLHDFIVSAAVNQGAQEIQVKGYNNYLRENSNIIIHFNPSIFTSGRLLRKFSFDVFTGDFLIQFPRSICWATQLTHLSLCGIRLPEGDADSAQLHLVLPLLETFHMSNCYSKHLKVLDISAPRLDALSIHNRRFGGSADFLGGCRLEIRTPNLTSLDYSGHVYVDCFTENLPRIADASLLISDGPGMVVEQTTSFAFKLFKELSSAQTLTLERFEVFSLDTLKVLLSPFTSLRTLELKSSCKVSASIHVMVHILHICNSVEKFVWDVNEFVAVELDEHLMLPQCRLSHLKQVHIKNLRVHENQIEFVKYLLKNSVVLENIIINTARDSPKRSIEENLKQFIEEEPSVRKSIKLHIL